MSDPLTPFRRSFGSYLGLTSYKRDGMGVTTTTWYVPAEDRILIRTDATSWKVKRMRRNPEVLVAPVDARGKVKGQAISARARELSDDERRTVVRGLARRYPLGFLWEVAVLRPLFAVTSKFGVGRRRGAPVFFEIVPEAVPQLVEDELATRRSLALALPFAGLLEPVLPVIPL